jgi:thioredoxin-dependent peroxiredoxin
MTIQFFGTLGRDGTSIRLPSSFRRSVRWLPQIGDTFPDFAASTTHGSLRFRDWAAGNWIYLFSYPAAFRSICTTEIADIATSTAEFDKRGVRVLALSCDKMEDLTHWLSEVAELLDEPIAFPVVADPEGVLAKAFGMIHPREHTRRTIRKSFVLDPQRRVRMVLEYPVRVERGVVETLRVIDALQAVDRLDLDAPGGWNPGDALPLPQELSAD